jgi:hypothetical protein
MMDILDTIGIRIRCRICGHTYEVPLRDVLISHSMMRHGGCPISEETECPPQAQIFLFEDNEVAALQDAWKKLQARAQKDGGDLVLMSQPEAEESRRNVA